MQTKASPAQTPQVSPTLAAGIHSLRGGGQPLDPAMRSFMEPRFGQDFSQVRVHTDNRAADMARSVHARAFTLGRDVVFGSGQYAPKTNQGQRLLAHELVHVVQQGPEVNMKEVPSEYPKNEMPERPISMPNSKGGSIQRQPDVPPPPTVFPHYSEWYFDVAEEMAELYARTCKDRLERGFIVIWNENTNKSYPGDQYIAKEEEKEDVSMTMGPLPEDKKPIYPVGFFHTHPPARPGFVRTKVGPSQQDKNVAKDWKLPGAVRDFSVPRTNDCKKSGTFFFGPEERPSK